MSVTLRVHICGRVSAGIIPPPRKARLRDIWPVDPMQLPTARELTRLGLSNLTKYHKPDDDWFARLTRVWPTWQRHHQAVGGTYEQLCGLRAMLDSGDLERRLAYHRRPPRRRATRGRRGITTAGRVKIRDAVAILERDFGRRSLAFWTHTMSPKNFELIRNRWDRYVTRLLYYLSRAVRAHTNSCRFVRVTELHKDGRPHLHVLFVNKARGRWIMTPQDMDNLSLRALRSMGVTVQPHDVRASNRIESVRKSASAYMSKYLSKKVTKENRQNNSNQKNWHPKSWYSIDRDTNRDVRESLIVWRTDMSLDEVISVLSQYVSNLRTVTITRNRNGLTDTRDYGVVGWVAAQHRRQLVAALDTVATRRRVVRSRASPPLPP